GYVLGS
nr:Chain A, Major prion protein [synthetic construct]3MD5_B Chain B, Major prion protein [synthetic construct]3NHD_A Chain A, Major prion protein [Homo sapiens]3NHD_B Chain B, Major prion protein [Homo sapiens]4WBV_A Chain A, PrP peptide [synthetic construct]4WBV_B Chain B, PrP peptide [synthetic construct]